MQQIYSSEDMQSLLAKPIDPALRKILNDRLDLLFPEFSDWDLGDLLNVVVIQAGDRLEDVERELGFSMFENSIDGARYPDEAFTPLWEWLVDRGAYYEFTFALCDSGLGLLVLVSKEDGVDPSLISFCRYFSVI